MPAPRAPPRTSTRPKKRIPRPSGRSSTACSPVPSDPERASPKGEGGVGTPPAHGSLRGLIASRIALPRGRDELCLGLHGAGPLQRGAHLRRAGHLPRADRAALRADGQGLPDPAGHRARGPGVLAAFEIDPHPTGSPAGIFGLRLACTRCSVPMLWSSRSELPVRCGVCVTCSTVSH